MEISEFYIKLLRGKGPTVISVVALDGTIQSSLVWSEYEEGLISIPMQLGIPKLKRLKRNNMATVLKVDPESEENYISLRCSLVKVEPEGAIERLNNLTQRHMGKETWYGEVVPDNDVEKEKEVTVYLKPEKIYFT